MKPSEREQAFDAVVSEVTNFCHRPVDFVHAVERLIEVKILDSREPDGGSADTRETFDEALASSEKTQALVDGFLRAFPMSDEGEWAATELVEAAFQLGRASALRTAGRGKDAERTLEDTPGERCARGEHVWTYGRPGAEGVCKWCPVTENGGRYEGSEIGAPPDPGGDGKGEDAKVREFSGIVFIDGCTTWDNDASGAWKDTMRDAFRFAKAIGAEENDRRWTYEFTELQQKLAAAEARLDGMTGERDSEREIAVGWERKCEDLDEKLREALKWSDEDQPIPEDEAISAAHPVHSGAHATYQEAMRMVGAKRSKGALVDLVTWLLLGAKRADTRDAALSEGGGS